MVTSAGSKKRTAIHSSLKFKYLILASLVLLVKEAIGIGSIGAGILLSGPDSASDLDLYKVRYDYIKLYNVYAYIEYLYIAFYEVVNDPTIGFTIIPRDNQWYKDGNGVRVDAPINAK